MNIELYDKAIDAMSDRVAKGRVDMETARYAHALAEMVTARAYIGELNQMPNYLPIGSPNPSTWQTA